MVPVRTSHAEVIFDQSRIASVAEGGEVNAVALLADKDAEGGLTVESGRMTLQTQWGAAVIVFPETTLSEVGTRLAVQFTATFENVDSSSRGLRLALANIPQPDILFTKSLQTLLSPHFKGTLAYGWNFRMKGPNNEESEIFSRPPDDPNLITALGGRILGSSSEALNIDPGVPQNITLRIEKTGADEITLSYEFEGKTSGTLIDKTPDNFTFNSFILFVSTSNPPATVVVENFTVSLDHSSQNN